MARTEGSVKENQDGDSSPFKLGLQSYSLRGLTAEGRPDRAKALAASKELGIHYWESYVAHVPMNARPEALEAIKKDANKFTVLGEGDLRTVDLLKALARNKYSYCLAVEYEEKAENPIDDIKACLAEATRAIALVRKA